MESDATTSYAVYAPIQTEPSLLALYSLYERIRRGARLTASERERISAVPVKKKSNLLNNRRDWCNPSWYSCCSASNPLLLDQSASLKGLVELTIQAEEGTSRNIRVPVDRPLPEDSMQDVSQLKQIAPPKENGCKYEGSTACPLPRIGSYGGTVFLCT